MKKKRKSTKLIKIFILFSMIVVLSKCSNKKGIEYTDTPTSGTVKIGVDETLFPVIDSEVNTFMAIYKDAKVIVKYESEAEVFKDMMVDSIKIGVVARKLNEDESTVFNKNKVIPVTTKIATDAIGFVVNNENSSDEFTFSRMKEILSGKIKKWKEADDLNKMNEDIKIVFDNAGSSATRFIKDSILGNQKLPDNWFALKTNPEVIDYVSKNKNAIGIIGVSWISDREDTMTGSFLKKVQVVGLSSNDPHDMEYYQPYQAYIALRSYPVCRDIYIVNREGRTGLGTGFAGYVAGQTGQLIVKKSGLMPATQSVRLVHLRPKIE